MTVYQKYALGAFALVFLWSAYNPVDKGVWFLENIAVFAFVPAIAVAAYQERISPLSYTLLLFFMALHLVGAHYSYAMVPFGFTLGEWLGTENHPNQYDQVVHLAFGLLVTYPLLEFFTKMRAARGEFWNYYLAFITILGFSALYEIGEWGAAFLMHPSESRGFQGSQGDYWDTNKDMALVALGAVATLSAAWISKLLKGRMPRRLSVPSPF